MVNRWKPPGLDLPRPSTGFFAIEFESFEDRRVAHGKEHRRARPAGAQGDFQGEPAADRELCRHADLDLGDTFTVAWNVGRWPLLAILVTALLAAACSDGGTGPADEPATFTAELSAYAPYEIAVLDLNGVAPANGVNGTLGSEPVTLLPAGDSKGIHPDRTWFPQQAAGPESGSRLQQSKEGLRPS